MNRRQMLRVMALSGLGITGLGGLARHSRAGGQSMLLITADPDADLRTLRHLGMIGPDPDVSVWPIAPVPQDLTLLTPDGIADPVRDSRVPAAIRAFTGRLRGRSAPGDVLLSVSSRTPGAPGTALIARDGQVWDRLDTRRRYDRIEVPVAQGVAVFQLRDGRLSMVEAPCRHALCRRMGARTHGTIVCAPNRLVATIHGSAGGLDGMLG